MIDKHLSRLLPTLFIFSLIPVLSVGLCGTKLGCGEGGCGACTVMISKYDPFRRKILYPLQPELFNKETKWGQIQVLDIPDGVPLKKKKLYNVCFYQNTLFHFQNINSEGWDKKVFFPAALHSTDRELFHCALKSLHWLYDHVGDLLFLSSENFCVPFLQCNITFCWDDPSDDDCDKIFIAVVLW